MKPDHEDIRTYIEATKAVVEYTSFQETSRRIFDSCRMLTGAASGYVALLSADGQENEVLFLESGGLPCSVNPDLPMPIRGLRAQAYETGRPVYNNSFMKSEFARFMPHGHVDLRNVMFVPIQLEGRVLGIIGLANKPRDFTDEDAFKTALFGDLIAIALRRSRTLDELSAEHRKTQDILGSIPSGLFIYQYKEPDLLYLEFGNEEAYKLTGINPREWAGREFNEIWPNAKISGITDKYLQVIKTGRNIELEDMQYQDERIEGAFRVRAFTIPGNRLGVGFENITKIKRAENDLLKSRERLALAASSAQLGIWDWDIVKNTMTWDDQMYRLYGVTDKTAFTGVELWQNGLHPDDYAYAWEACQAALRGERPYDLEFRVKHPDGTVRYLKADGMVLRDEHGNPVRMIGVNHDITERKQTEDELRQTKAILQTALDCSPAGIAIADAPDGKLRYVNDAGLLIRGGDRKSVINGVGVEQYVASWQILDFDGRPLRNDEVPLARALMFGETNSRDFIIRRNEGDDRVVIANAAPIKDENGQITAAIVVFTDITERKQAEENLRLAYVKLDAFWNIATLENADIKTICDHVLESVAQMTASRFGFFGFINNDESIMTIHSWSGEAMKGCSMVDKPADFPILQAGVWAEAIRKRAPLIINDYAAHHPAKKGLPDGHVPLKNLMVVPVISHGKIVSVAAVANRDAGYTQSDAKHLSAFAEAIQGIIDRKQAEKALKRSKEILSETELIGKVGGWSFNIDTMEQIWTDEVYRIHEIDISSNPSVPEGINFYTAESRPIIEKAVQRAIEFGEDYALDLEIITAKGNTRAVHAIGKADLKNRRIYGFFQDITERKRMEEALQKTQKLESLGILAGGIAHDFNNLMGGIFGHIDMAREYSKDEKTGRHLTQAMSAIERARGLTAQLLTFAKGGDPVRKIGRLFPFVEETVRFALSGAAAACTFDVSPELRACNFDRNQIGQVIDNLIINAQQAMPAGGSITVRARNITFAEQEHPLLPKGEYVMLSVTDTGIGIPKELQPRIFDPFFSTKTKGHGLGLASSYSIISRHGGCITVDSEPGKGSTFHVYLPAYAASSVTEVEIPVQHHTGSGTFIVMDDEEIMRDTIGDMLTSFGYTVVCKENGKDAVDFLAAETEAGRTVAGMIFDLTVPGGMGGKDAVAEIRKHDTAVPVFAASGYADDPAMQHPAAYGFTASICKPFRKSELEKMLAAATSSPAHAGAILMIEDEEAIATQCVEFLTDAGYTVHAAARGADGLRFFREHHREIRLVIADAGEAGDGLLTEIRKISPGVHLIVISGNDQSDPRVQAVLNGIADYSFLIKPFRLRPNADRPGEKCLLSMIQEHLRPTDT